MRLVLQSKGIRVAPEVEDFLQRRMRFAMGRFGTRVRRVRVVLEDINGPRGGCDQRCLIEAKLWPKRTVVTDATDSSIDAAIGRAVDRLSRRVRDVLDRRHDWHAKKLRQPLPGWIAA